MAGFQPLASVRSPSVSLKESVCPGMSTSPSSRSHAFFTLEMAVSAAAGERCAHPRAVVALPEPDERPVLESASRQEQSLISSVVCSGFVTVIGIVTVSP